MPDRAEISLPPDQPEADVRLDQHGRVIPVGEPLAAFLVMPTASSTPACPHLAVTRVDCKPEVFAGEVLSFDDALRLIASDAAMRAICAVCRTIEVCSVQLPWGGTEVDLPICRACDSESGYQPTIAAARDALKTAAAARRVMGVGRR